MKGRYCFIAVAALLLLPFSIAGTEDFDDDTPGLAPTGDYEFIIVENQSGILVDDAVSFSSPNSFAVGNTNSLDEVAFSFGADCEIGIELQWRPSTAGTPSSANTLQWTNSPADSDDFVSGVHSLVQWRRLPNNDFDVATLGTDEVAHVEKPFGTASSTGWYQIRSWCDLATNEVVFNMTSSASGFVPNETRLPLPAAEAQTLNLLRFTGHGRVSRIDDLSFPEAFAPDKTWQNDRNLVDMWVGVDDNGPVFVRETGTGNFADGEGLIYKLNANLQLQTSLDGCATNAQYTNPNGISGFAFSPANLHVISACYHRTQDAYELAVFDGRSSQAMQEIERSQVLLLDEECSYQGGGIIPGSGTEVCSNAPATHFFGPMRTQESSVLIALDLIEGEGREIQWTNDGPFETRQFSSPNGWEGVGISYKCSVFSLIGDDGFQMYAFNQATPLINNPGLTGYSTALHIIPDSCVSPAAPPLAYSNDYAWITTDAGLELWEWDEPNNLFTLKTSVADYTAKEVRLSWDGQYLMVWSSDTATVLDAVTLDLVASAGGYNNIGAVGMDVANNYLFVMDTTEQKIDRYSMSAFTESLGEADFDDDGWTNTEEDASGTDPNDANDVPTDEDGDGLSDEWENEHFGNTTASDGTGDSDGDGFTDAEEFQHNTDPNDDQSFPVGNPTLGNDEDLADDAGYGTGSEGGAANQGSTTSSTSTSNNSPNNLPRGDLFPEPSDAQISLFGSRAGVSIFQALVFYITTGGGLIAGAISLGAKPTLGGAAGIIAVGGFLGLLLGFGFGIVTGWILGFGALILVAYIVFTINGMRPQGA